ncbi:YdcF family protein [bacterium]|nr:YdcF family protein [bacterium]
MNARLKLPKQSSAGGRGRYRVPLPPFAWYRSTTKSTKSRLKIIFWVFLSLVVLCAVAYLFRKPILTSLGDALVYESELQPADVIIVLGGGGTLRAEQAAKLYHEGYAKKLLVLLPKTLPDDAPYRDLIDMERKLVEMVLAYRHVPQNQIDWAGRPVFSTYEETMLIREWMETHHAHSAIVVSGYFQSSRAQWVLDRAFQDTDIQVQVTPAPEPDISAENWWTDIDGILNVQNEYVKYAYYRLRGLLGRQ